jgi:hypothetical protein
VKKGIVQLIPLVAVAVILSAGAFAISKNASPGTQNILSSSDQKGNSGKGSSDSSSSKSDSGKSDSNPSQARKESSSSDSKESRSQSTDAKNGAKPSPQSKRFETSVGQLETEIEDEERNDAEAEDEDGTENGLEEESTSSSTPGRKIRTNFPITVNPETGEKIVTTPSGVKIVILPDVAIQNMIRAGFPVILPPPEATPSASPEGTPSASPEATSSAQQAGDIELTELNNELVYIVDAAKEEDFFGVIPVEIKVKGVLSAEDGRLMEIRRSLISRFLDLFSF